MQQINKNSFFTFRDPMDALLLEQHLRAPLRLFPDPIMSQFAPQDADAASAALLEKARQQLQMWGRSPYTELLLPQMYQRPNLNALNLGLWQGQWPPQLSAGFLSATSQNRTPPPVSSTPSSSGSPSPDIRAKSFARFSPYQIPHHSQSSRSPSNN